MQEKLPIVTIIGRQNVGKSTLFNSLIRQKKAIVDSEPGLTRDIISCRVNRETHSYLLCDTPGMDIKDSSDLSRAILKNATEFLSKSSVIILLLENPAPMPFDFELAEMVRKLSIPKIIAVNKMDSTKDFENLNNFYEIGFNDILPISSHGRVNLNLLLDKISEQLPVKKLSSTESDCRIAIVGRPNSGKSTLLNSFLGYSRSMVSDIPGTTRDSVDEDFTFNNKRITVIDTAGIRRKSRINENIDYYSLTRTVESIKRSDVIIHLIDASVGLTETDKKISDEIIKARKPLVIAINKWDSIEKDHKTFDEFKDKLIFKYYRAEDFPIISISAKEKQRIHKLVTIALELSEKSSRRIETARLNKIVQAIQKSHRVPMLGERLKIYYMTQTESNPPQFKVFVNNAENFKKDIIRYLVKELQSSLDLKGIPIHIDIEGKKKR